MRHLYAALTAALATVLVAVALFFFVPGVGDNQPDTPEPAPAAAQITKTASLDLVPAYQDDESGDIEDHDEDDGEGEYDEAEHDEDEHEDD